MPKTKTYYVMIERDSASEPWAVQAGSYERSDILAEVQDRLDHDVRVSNIKVLTTTDKQADIDAAIVRLNAREAARLPRRMPRDLTATDEARFAAHGPREC